MKRLIPLSRVTVAAEVASINLDVGESSVKMIILITKYDNIGGSFTI